MPAKQAGTVTPDVPMGAPTGAPLSSILSAHVSLGWASVEELEPFLRRSGDELLARVGKLPGVSEAVLVATCNRAEIYVSAWEPSAARRHLEELFLEIGGPAAARVVRFHEEEATLRHLLRVAAGLESLIVGEDQVLHQVRESMQQAERLGTVGNNLGLVFKKALSVGKLVRTRTGISRGSVSMGSAAVELAEDALGSLEGRRLLVLGAGEVADLVAQALARRRLHAVIVANRTFSHAEDLARRLQGRAIPFDELPQALREAHVVICATSAPHHVLDRRAIEAARAGDEPLVLIDISIPRNIAPDVQEIPGVTLYDMEGLRGVAEENLERRREEADRAARIVDGELELLRARLKEQAADDVLRALHARLDAIASRELAKAHRKAKLSAHQKEVVEAMLASALAKALADPTRSLKAAARAGREDLLTAAAEIFRLEDEDGSAP
ncbi:MAG: glutamyl-tRNA reductase [Methanobacteriota archaeon]